MAVDKATPTKPEVKADTKWIAKDAAAQNLLLGALADDLITEILPGIDQINGTAADLWMAVKHSFHPDTLMSGLDLFNALIDR